MNGQNHRRLLEALVGEDYLELWQTNAWFHHGIETLARMLPLFVDGLALQAREKNDDVQVEAIKELLSLHPTPEETR